MTKESFPNNSDIYKLKAEARKERAARTFGEKIAAMEALREHLAPFKAAREQAAAAKRKREAPET